MFSFGLGFGKRKFILIAMFAFGFTKTYFTQFVWIYNIELKLNLFAICFLIIF